MTCPLGCRPTSRAERRRLEREVDATRPADGAGQGWRRSRGRRGVLLGHRYPVREPGPVDVEQLAAESDAVARRLGCTCVVGAEAAA